MSAINLYLFENPWPLALMLFGIAVVFFLLFRVTRRNRDAFIALALIAAAAGMFLLDRLVVTAAEQISNELDRLRDAALRGDAETLVTALSARFEQPATTRNEMADLIRSEFGRTKLYGISINGRVIEADQEHGVANFVANVAGGRGDFRADSYPLRLRVEFVLENGTWKIARIQRFELVGPREEIPLLRP